MMFEKEKRLLPEFPRTMHLPLEPNTSSGDKVASESDMRAFLSGKVMVEEKLDGSNMGVAVIDGMPVVRNRSHILRKNYSGLKTPAQVQFGRVWTWLYEGTRKVRNIDKVLAVQEAVGSGVTIYGEWLFARHVVEYDQLPDLFVPYDVWHQEEGKFLDPLRTMRLLMDAGFEPAPVRAYTAHARPELLIAHRDQPSMFSSTSMSEGIYLKTGDGEWGTARYKMVAPWFKSDDDWNKKPLVKNRVGKMQAV